MDVTALSAGRHNGRERRVSHHGQRQPIPPSSNCNELVLSDGSVSVANYRDGGERRRGVVASLPGGFSVDQQQTGTFKDLKNHKLNSFLPGAGRKKHVPRW